MNIKNTFATIKDTTLGLAVGVVWLVDTNTKHAVATTKEKAKDVAFAVKCIVKP